jgi:hypothetical protein
MKAVILAVSLSLPLSFSVASAQLTKMIVGLQCNDFCASPGLVG